MEFEFGLYHYIFLAIGALVSLFLVVRAGVSDKIEHFLLTFFLLTGNFNEALTFKVPGVSFFELQPIRLLFLVLTFYLIRKLLFGKQQFFKNHTIWKLPLFLVFLFLNMIFVSASLFKHTQVIGFSEVIVYIVHILTFVVLIFSFRILIQKESLNLIGKTIIIGAIVSVLLSYIQFFVEPEFMRIGDFRKAFGTTIRPNGMFKTEYFNGYFIITAVIWTLVTFRNSVNKYLILAFLSSGVLLTFQRMGWLILALLLVLYFIRFERPSLELMWVGGLSGLAIIVFILTLFFSDIMNSTMVQDRLTDSVDRRGGYYEMVLDNIGERPLLGYGNKNNDIYYYTMLLVTRDRKRATGEEGDIHSGYFQTLFYYGVPAFVFFVGFVLATVLYFERLSRYHLFFAIPFLFAILFLFGNLTNTLLYSKYISTLMAIHIGLGWRARYMEDFFK